MAIKGKGTSQNGKAVNKKTPSSRSLPIAEQGLNTDTNFVRFHSALILDLVTGAITPQIGNAICNSTGAVLKMAELGLKYGSPNYAPRRKLQRIR